VSGIVFIIAFVTSVASYFAMAALFDRRMRLSALRRLTLRTPAATAARRAVQPLLIRVADDVRGRIAIRLLERLRLKQLADQFLETAALKWGAAGLAHRAVAGFLAGFGLLTLATHNQHSGFALAAGLAGASTPVLYVRRKAGARIRAFEEQFADCLEFISRSMRAGHAFSVSLEMVHREFSEPISAEFRRTFEEQNLGQPLEIVLKKLTQRVPSMDVHFFVSAVLLQKRTGGNLAELLDKLAQIIRERFKLRARVRAISAQGLMTGRILAAIPMAVAALMFVVNTSYAWFFVDDPIGHEMVAGAVALLLIGYLIIRKIVIIEV
jgi:tight adherence protein B